MKTIKYNKPHRMTFEQFAQQHEFELMIGQRDDWAINDYMSLNGVPLPRFYARFNGVYVLEDGWKLVGESGNGNTENEAIANYAEIISGKTIKYDDEYIEVPVLEF